MPVMINGFFIESYCPNAVYNNDNDNDNKNSLF